MPKKPSPEHDVSAKKTLFPLSPCLYALEAERKMGEMLAETDLQHGARGKGKSGVTTSNPTPTLSDLGLTKRESAEDQMLASIPQEDFKERIEIAKAKEEKISYN